MFNVNFVFDIESTAHMFNVNFVFDIESTAQFSIFERYFYLTVIWN